jgi:cell division septation protein DedD
VLSESDLASPAPKVKPATPSVTTVQTTPATQRLLSGFRLQSPVFNNTQEAETLYRKLKENNIPVTLETRVKVGPFRTREEAELARERMEALGIMMNDMIPPKTNSSRH